MNVDYKLLQSYTVISKLPTHLKRYLTLFFTIALSWSGRGLKDGLLWGSASCALKIVLQKLRSQCFGGMRKRALSNR